MARDSENLLSGLGGRPPGPPAGTLIRPGTGQNAPTGYKCPSSPSPRQNPVLSLLTSQSFVAFVSRDPTC